MTLLTWIYVNMMEVIAAWVQSIYYVITFRVHKKPIFAYFYPFTHLLARDVLLMKKLEIKKTKPTFIISVLKVEYILGGNYSKKQRSSSSYLLT